MSDYREMIQILRDHIGARLDMSRAEGHDELRKRMRKVLNMDTAEADATLDTLIGTGQIRYVTSDPTGAEQRAAQEIQVGSVASAPTAGSGAPIVVSGLETSGYWQIGGTEFDDTPNVRKGQVRPKGL
jgi:hypothetical protein